MSLDELRLAIQLHAIRDYFEKDKESFMLVVNIIERKKGYISLRALEFMCTRMAIEKKLQVEESVASVTNIYENGVDTYKKKWFDSFRRTSGNANYLIEYEQHGKKIKTTVAQMTFFMIISKQKILQSAQARRREILAEMSRSAKSLPHGRHSSSLQVLYKQ